MVRKKLKLKKHGLGIVGLAAAAMFAAAIPATTVLASGDETAETDNGLPLVEISMQDSNPMYSLKREVITYKVEHDRTISPFDVDVEKSQIELTGFDRNKSGLQNVTAKITLADKDGNVGFGYSFTQDVAVEVINSSSPQLKLKSDSIIVNNGDVWNSSSYIAYINDDSGILPVLTVDGKVNMKKDGVYNVQYTAIDTEGNKTTASLKVTVKTPDEVIKAREEAERKKKEEEEEAARIAEEERLAEEQRQYEEEQRRLEEERQKQEQAEQEQQSEDTGWSTASGNKETGSGYNPYGGGWGNCTSGAWMAVLENTGVALPQWGNAGAWVYGAQASGYATGSTPAAGSVAVFSNHVAYVADVSEDGSSIYVIEGGFLGGYHEGWQPASNSYGQPLVGFVYVNN